MQQLKWEAWDALRIFQWGPFRTAKRAMLFLQSLWLPDVKWHEVRHSAAWQANTHILYLHFQPQGNATEYKCLGIGWSVCPTNGEGVGSPTESDHDLEKTACLRALPSQSWFCWGSYVAPLQAKSALPISLTKWKRNAALAIKWKEEELPFAFGALASFETFWNCIFAIEVVLLQMIFCQLFLFWHTWLDSHLFSVFFLTWNGWN